MSFLLFSVAGSIEGRPRSAGVARGTRRASRGGAAPCLALVLLAGTAAAHDWWLEPNRTSVRAGEQVEVSMLVGVGFRGDRVTRDPARIGRFFATSAGAVQEQELTGEPGAEPAGRFTAREPGMTIVAYHSKPARLFLQAPDFETYLHEEGLERIVELRAQRGQSQKMGLEQYSRCAKALVHVEPGAAGAQTAAGTPFDRELGLPLELVALVDPRTLAVGSGASAFSVRLTFGGKPLEGALIVALERDHPDEVLKVRSDADGRASFLLPRAGFWLVKAVHMVDGPAESRLDWESFWASLTFAVPPAPAE